MIGFLYALLFGGLAVAVGSSSGGDDAGGTTGGAPAAPEPPTPGDTSDEEAPPTAPEETPAAPGGTAPETPQLPDSAYDIGWNGLSAEEQMIVELVNRARMDPLAEVDRLNEALAAGISNSPVQPLAVTAPLSAAARDHSEDMDNRDFFSHTNPDGESPGDRAIEAGNGSRFVGENIGWIGSSAPPDAQTRAEAHHENLWDSDGHQVNMMRGNWSEIGLGYDYGDYRGLDHSTFATELFGDQNQTFLTGVVIEDDDGDDFYDIGEGQGDVRITAFNGDDVYATATWASGGYALALPAGTYRVVFEGGDLDQPYETDVTIGGENVKLDVIDPGGAVLAALNVAPGDPGTTGAGDTPPGLPDALASLATLGAIEGDGPVIDEPEPEEGMIALF
ncbi:MAG: CAP domain-containing protein [Silicimonas sp.]|nr:CAP domain-containing protein [Silicimonas sp.]